MNEIKIKVVVEIPGLMPYQANMVVNASTWCKLPDKQFSGILTSDAIDLAKSVDFEMLVAEMRKGSCSEYAMGH